MIEQKVSKRNIGDSLDSYNERGDQYLISLEGKPKN